MKLAQNQQKPIHIVKKGGPKAAFFALPQNQGATSVAGWSSPVARQAHNLKVVGSNPTPATNVGITPGSNVIPTGEASPRNQRQYNSEDCYTDGASGPRNQRQYNSLVITI